MYLAREKERGARERARDQCRLQGRKRAKQGEERERERFGDIDVG